MSSLVVGSHVPQFRLMSPVGETAIPDPAGRQLLLIFFQEQSTPACTAQITAFDREAETISALGGVAVAISTDSVHDQAAFARACGLKSVLFAADPDGYAARLFGVYDPASRRARRSVFLVAGDGILSFALPWYNPLNGQDLLGIFHALGFDEADRKD